ncbi:BamA/TamA family outer membrane protein [Algoriphagus algorifonticola]|uniref:BamA/TamA family outer membrane protein n=1 Tax=Algoriphagus algorifonticola TaxID=2593007 RepID=UPI0011A21BE8|nr:BamA/TamA family outer membrane protein [Algoriphagus algorifonticola]
MNSSQKTFLLFLIFFAFTQKAFSQASVQEKSKDWTLSVLPLVYYTPETRWVFGAGAVSNFNLGDSVSTYESQLAAGVAYSLRKQFLSYLSGRIFTPGNKELIYGEVGWYDYVYFYFGQGMNVSQENEEVYSAKFPRVRINYAWALGSNWYLGGGLRFDAMDIYQKEESGQLVNDGILGNEGGRNSGLGPVVLYDSRDNQLYPVDGAYFEASIQGYGKALGGEFPYARIFADYRKIIPIGKNQIIATQGLTEMTFGDVPFFALPMLGGNRLMRGLFEGKYREKQVVVLQAEYRYKFAPRWGITAFSGLGNAFSQENPFVLSQTKFTYGAGGRFQLNKRKRLNLRLDLAHSPGEPFQFYFTFGEAF